MPQPNRSRPAGFESVDTGKALPAPPADPSKPAAEEQAATPSPNPSALPTDLLAKLDASVPKLEELRVLEELRAIAGSRMARLVLCIDLGVPEATSFMVQALENKDWQEVNVNAAAHAETRGGFTASSTDFRVTGSAYQGAFTSCEQSKGKTRIALSFQEIESDEAPTRVKPGPADAVNQTAKKMIAPASINMRRERDQTGALRPEPVAKDPKQDAVR